MNSPKNSTTAVQKFVREQHGATMVEYGLLVALVAVAALSAVGLMSQSLLAIFARVASVL